MGASTWSDQAYSNREGQRVNSGRRLAHTADIREGRTARKVHDALNPKGVTREARDSAAHPDSLPIMVFFDVTGSMGQIPYTLQTRLANLMRLLVDRGYVAHPQVCFGAIGDAISDSGPLQVGQFESGLEMDDDLERVWVEAGGGGSGEESYELAYYFAARHTATDAWDLRQRKGYVFTMGDEAFYPTIGRNTLRHIVGDSVEGDLSTAALVREAQERWNLFHIIVEQGSHGSEIHIREEWQRLLGEDHVIRMTKADNIAELIATAVGITEGAVTLDVATENLRQLGTDAAALAAISEALTNVVARSIRLRPVAHA